MKFVATITNCVQVGPDDYETRRDSKVFDYSESFSDVMLWASIYTKNPTINSIVISDFDELLEASK